MESGWAEHHLESFDTKQNLAAYVRALRSCWGFSYEDRLKPHIPVATDRVLPLSLASRSETFLLFFLSFLLFPTIWLFAVLCYIDKISRTLQAQCCYYFSCPDSLIFSYKGMRLVTLQSKEKAARLKSLRAMNKTVENMRTKIGMKNNVIRKLPKNCPY